MASTNDMNTPTKVPCGGFVLGEGLALGKDGKTLNVSGGGSQADWNQNDESAVDYVKNRPGGYTKATPGYEITWDGVVGDKVVVDGGEIQLVKVSDRVFTVEELIGATVTIGGQSSTINNDDIQSQNGVIIANMGVFVCTAPTTIQGITIPETGTYFVKTENRFISSLSKPDSTTTVKIPAELTTVVGGYDAAERTSVIFDGTVKASDFTERSVGASYYAAPIALAEDLIEGATVSGTIDGIQVSGTVGAGHVVLYAIAQVSPNESSGGSLKVAEIGGDAGNYQIALEKQPESDLTIHLTQAIPAHAVTIPEEYLELTETNAAIETAQNAANTAQNAANTAQSAASSAQNAASSTQNAANAAKTTAEEAKTTANNAQTTAEAAKATANTAKTTAETAKTASEMAVYVDKNIVVLYDSTGTKIQSATWSTVVKGSTISIFVDTNDGVLTDETYATANLGLGPFNPIYKGIEGFPNDSVVGIIYDFNVVNSIPTTWGYATKRLNSVNLVPASNNKVIPQRMLILFIQPCTTL